MTNETHVSFTGYIATEPALRLLDDGRSMTTLRVASTPRRYSRKTGEWADGPTSFFSVACWRKLAENAALCLRKGEPVVVVGTMRVRRYDAKDGSPRTDVEVDATSIGHDLSRGVARFLRTKGAPGAAGTAGTGAPGAPADPMDADGDIAVPDAGAGTEPEAGPRAGPGLEPGSGAGAEPAAGGADEVLDDRAVAALLAGDGGSPGEEAAVPL